MTQVIRPEIPYLKKKYETQFSINQIFNDKIEKKNQFSKRIKR